jgi:hypothetical protein
MIRRLSLPEVGDGRQTRLGGVNPGRCFLATQRRESDLPVTWKRVETLDRMLRVLPNMVAGR